MYLDRTCLQQNNGSDCCFWTMLNAFMLYVQSETDLDWNVLMQLPDYIVKFRFYLTDLIFQLFKTELRHGCGKRKESENSNDCVIVEKGDKAQKYNLPYAVDPYQLCENIYLLKL